jgi:hypothetical protein
MTLSALFEILCDYPRLIEACSVGLSIIGFSILIGEVGSAQKTEIHVLTRDIIKGIREARENVKTFVASVREELAKAMNDGVQGRLLANSLLTVYFSESAWRESYAGPLSEHGLDDGYIQSLGLADANVYHSIKRAIQAAKTLGGKSITKMSDVERAIFDGMYAMPRGSDWPSLSVWLQEEERRSREMPIFTDLSSEFIELDVRWRSLMDRRRRFYLGIVLTMSGFAVQFLVIILERHQ